MPQSAGQLGSGAEAAGARLITGSTAGAGHTEAEQARRARGSGRAAPSCRAGPRRGRRPSAGEASRAMTWRSSTSTEPPSSSPSTSGSTSATTTRWSRRKPVEGGFERPRAERRPGTRPDAGRGGGGTRVRHREGEGAHLGRPRPAGPEASTSSCDTRAPRRGRRAASPGRRGGEVGEEHPADRADVGPRPWASAIAAVEAPVPPGPVTATTGACQPGESPSGEGSAGGAVGATDHAARPARCRADPSARRAEAGPRPRPAPPVAPALAGPMTTTVHPAAWTASIRSRSSAGTSHRRAGRRTGAPRPAGP